MEEKQDTHVHLEYVSGKSDVAEQAHEAGLAAEHEKNMSFMQAIRAYPKAVGWSVLLSTALIMEGYDTACINQLFSQPGFQIKYGKPNPDGSGFNLTAAWQAGLSNGILVGEIFGLFISGYLCEILGYRLLMLGSLALITGLIFIPFFAPNIIVLEVGEILCGIPWGVFQTATTAYASMICPLALRHYLTSYVNLAWVFGQLLSSGVGRAMVGHAPNEWSYRIPFAIQWIWPVPLFTAIYFAPEAPWWLIRKGKIDEAQKALVRLTTEGEREHIPKTLAMMIHTHELEQAVVDEADHATYWDCFKGTDLRRTEIVCMVWAIQVLCGSYINTTYFLEQAGMDPTAAFDVGVGQTGLAVLGTLSSWVLMQYIGRRTLYLYGLIGMGTLLFIVGCLSLAPADQKGPLWAQGALLMIFVFTYDLTIGPVCYSLVAELSSNRLRQKAIVLARNVYNILGLVASTILPYMTNSSAWNWKGKLGFFWFGSCALSFVWVFFRLPEPKGRTFAELDMMFEMKVPARKFRTTVVNPYDVDEVALLVEKHE